MKKNMNSLQLKLTEEVKVMNKKVRIFSFICAVLMAGACFSGCGKNAEPSSSAENETTASETKAVSSQENNTSQTESMTEDKTEPAKTSLENNLKPSEGLEFESNGDGSCTIIGIGTCEDNDIVIPLKSPNGDTVTLIGEYAFMSLEDVDSVTLENYSYEVDKRAFQYGEFKKVNIVGGNPIIKESAFSSCEDLTAITFKDCKLQINEYAFLSSGKDAEVSFTNCTGLIDKRAFQYGDFASLTISKSELEIDNSAFSSCEELTSVTFSDSTVTAGEYAFLSCGDSAVVEIKNCSITLDDRAFQYASLSSLSISGSKAEIGDSAFSSCEDLEKVNIDCTSVTLGEYAFMSCKDLTNVSICDNSASDNEIEIDDRAFQYCEKLESVKIGKGNVKIGEYAFSSCADKLSVSAAGKSYTAKELEKGLK